MLAPATGLARTYRQLGKPPGPMPSFAEQQLRNLTPDAIDFCADDFEDYADGDTVGSWASRRGGLTASVTGTPAYTAPDQTLRVPSVAYASTGERHDAPAVDWSTSNTATLLSVWYTDLAAPANGGIASLHANLTQFPSQSGGVEHLLGASSIYWTALHYPDGAGNFWLERDTVADDGAAHVNVSVHDTDAATTADEIRGYQDGAEIVGSTTGTSGGGANWQAVLYPVLGARGNNAAEGLDGRLHRFIAMPSALTDAQALRASRCLLYTART
jgi:hypothetical protein